MLNFFFLGGGVSQETVLLDMRNKEQYSHTLFCSRRFWNGRLQMYTIQIYPFWKLQADWIPSGLTGRGGGGLPR